MAQEMQNPMSSSSRQLLLDLPVNTDVLFSNHKNIYKQTIEKRQRKLLRKISFITPFLHQGETILCITTGCSPVPVIEQFLTGWIVFYLKRSLFIFTDEIYEYFLYDGRQHISPGSLPGMAKRTITISGFSKTFSITGWRIGYSVSHSRWAQMIGYISDLIYVCAPAPLQMGAAEGILQLKPEYYRELCALYAKKRDKVCNALIKARLKPCIPQGSY